MRLSRNLARIVTGLGGSCMNGVPYMFHSAQSIGFFANKEYRSCSVQNRQSLPLNMSKNDLIELSSIVIGPRRIWKVLYGAMSAV